MKKLAFILIILFSFVSNAQSFQITYKQYFEGKLSERQNPIILLANPQESILLNEKIANKNSNFPYEILQVTRPNNSVNTFGFFNENDVTSYSDDKAIEKQKFTLSSETKKILGYNCKKATITINSNSIVVWYTNDIKGIKGAPSVLGQDLGLVLEQTRNGSNTVQATEVKKIKSFSINQFLQGKIPNSTDELSYKDLLWKSRFTTIPVFNDAQINFVEEKYRESEIRHYAHGTIILKKVTFPKITDDQLVFAEVKQKSNGDAYDRTGTVFMIPENKKLSFFTALDQGIDSVPNFTAKDGKTYKAMVATDNYEPALELMRFYTPFGISQYNYLKLKDKTWHEINPYRQDITELSSQLSEKTVWIGTYIGNYDKGGHKVSLDITIHRNGQNLFKNNVVIPLFNTLNIMENDGQTYATLFGTDEGLKVKFKLEKPLQNVQLRYTTTGHGGWTNGDEFNPLPNTIYLDGKEHFSFIPWRTDCGSYRLYNPASGNFANGLSSSDLSRSNWCPGTVTNPNFISLGNLPAGEHIIEVKIPQGKPEGSSFSYWNVSGTLIGRE